VSSTAIIWLAALSAALVLSLRRPAWGFTAYLLTFFANPEFWWWGRGFLSGYRWNFYAGCAFLIAVALRKVAQSKGGILAGQLQLTDKLALALLANATVVHFLFAQDLASSFDAYFLLVKFVLLYFLLRAAIGSERDLRIVIISILLCVAYLGFEVTINKRGRIIGGRLENVGAPGASEANLCACLIVSILPVIGSRIFAARGLERAVTILFMPLIFNILFLCNSRGGFLALIAGGLTLVGLSSGRQRKKALATLVLAAAGSLFLMKDPRVVERFLTIFVGEEERDSSAANRLVFWRAGLKMISEHPLGTGGLGFKRGHGWKYLSEVGVTETERAIHNGYINEACEWGVQGLVIRLLFISSAVAAGLRASIHRRRAGDLRTAFFGSCLIAGMVCFLVATAFLDSLDAEWGYWLAALLVAYSVLYGPPRQGAGVEGREQAAAAPAFAGART
jgi:putative inorganic carbon (HCO3(-)) transporter